MELRGTRFNVDMPKMIHLKMFDMAPNMPLMEFLVNLNMVAWDLAIHLFILSFFIIIFLFSLAWLARDC